MENIHGFSNLLAVLQGYKLCKYFDCCHEKSKTLKGKGNVAKRKTLKKHDIPAKHVIIFKALII